MLYRMGCDCRVLAVIVAVVSSGAAVAATSSDEFVFREAYQTYERLHGQERHKQSLPYAKRALEFGEKIFGDAHANTAALTYNYALNLLAVGDADSSKAVLKETVRRYQLNHGEDSEELIPVYMDLGRASAKFRESQPQRGYYERALKIASGVYGKSSARYAHLTLDAGIGLLDLAVSPKAKSYLVRAFNLYKQLQGENHPTTGLAALYLGKFYLTKRQHGFAMEYLEIALQAFQSDTGTSNDLELMTHAFLVEVKEELGRRDEATEHCLAIGRISPADPNKEFQPLFRRKPEYPRYALARGLEGYVDFRFTIDEQGFV